MAAMATDPIATPPPSGIDRAQRLFFQSHVSATNCYNARHALADASHDADCTVFGSAFSPPGRGNKRYFVACTSTGCIAVWDVQAERTGSGPLAPIVNVRVCGQVLYDLKFIRPSGGGPPLLVVSGDPGIVIYKWCDFESAIDAQQGVETSSPTPTCQDPPRRKAPQRAPSFVELRPVTTFRPHPSPAAACGDAVEINCTSYSAAHGSLYGAAGDAFGCYQWDLATQQLRGTFGAGGRRPGGGHRDYLHVVKSIPESEGVGAQCVITGGEDGNMGIWDGKERKLIEMRNIQTTLDQHKEAVTSETTPSSRGFGHAPASWHGGANLWVSSLASTGNFLCCAGGGTSGFMTLWHLPTRTFTSGCVTRESWNAVVRHSSSDCFVSGGNEGRISFWEAASTTRAGRAWSAPPATYTIADDPDSALLVVGGAGGTLDCFAERVRVSQLQFLS